jgi:hypothetical protein
MCGWDLERAAGDWGTHKDQRNLGRIPSQGHEAWEQSFFVFVWIFCLEKRFDLRQSLGSLLTERPGKEGRGCATRDRKRKSKKQSLRKERNTKKGLIERGLMKDEGISSIGI